MQVLQVLQVWRCALACESGDVPFSHPSLGLCVFFLSFFFDIDPLLGAASEEMQQPDGI